MSCYFWLAALGLCKKAGGNSLHGGIHVGRVALDTEQGYNGDSLSRQTADLGHIELSALVLATEVTDKHAFGKWG